MEFWKPKDGEKVKIRFLPREESPVDILSKYYEKTAPIVIDVCPFCEAGIPRKKGRKIK